MLKNIELLGICGVFSVVVVLAFLLTRHGAVQALSQTSYPGQRSISSGGFNLMHLLSSQLGYQFTSANRAAQYSMQGVASNQSETSDFLLLSPLLLIPILVLMYKDWRNHRYIDRLLLPLLICFVVFILHLFVPAFSPIATMLLLGKVPVARLLIGVGLLNTMIIVAYILRAQEKPKHYWPSPRASGSYALLLLALELCINMYIHDTNRGFIGIYRTLAFALPLPIITFLLLRKRFITAVALYFAFSFFISFSVNPLYRGLSIVTQNPVSQAMVRATKGSSRRWVVDSVLTENLAAANGLRSLSGVYYYPQKSLWSIIPNARFAAYNRYAHATFGFFTAPNAAPQLKLAADDQIRITTGICSTYLQQENVGFVLTSQELTGSCITHTVQINTATATFYIYQLR